MKTLLICSMMCLMSAQGAVLNNIGFEDWEVDTSELNRPDRPSESAVYFDTRNDPEDGVGRVKEHGKKSLGDLPYDGSPYDGRGGFPIGYFGVGKHYLAVETGVASSGRALCRTVNPVGAGGAAPAYNVGMEGLWFDMVTLLTGFEEERTWPLLQNALLSVRYPPYPVYAAPAPGFSIGIDKTMNLYVLAVETEDYEGSPYYIRGVTNLCLQAGRFDASAESVVPEKYVLSVEGVEDTQWLTAWHRITIRVKRDSADAGHDILGVQVYVDGKLAVAEGTSRTFFPLYVQTMDMTVTAVRFQGIGKLDDLVVSTDCPDFRPLLPDGTHEKVVNGVAWTFSVVRGKATVVAVDRAASGAITVPEEVGGCVVNGIAGSAFSGCDELTSITVPQGVMQIDKAAFAGCADTLLVNGRTLAEHRSAVANPKLETEVRINGMTQSEYDRCCLFAGVDSVKPVLPGALAPASVETVEVRDGKLNLGVRFERTDSLESPKWYPVGTESLSTRDDGTFEIVLPAGLASGFYRLISKDAGERGE